MTDLRAVIASRAFARLVDAALAEDIHTGDVTTEAIVGSAAGVRAHWIAKQSGVVAGLDAAAAVFRRLDAGFEWHPAVADGETVALGDRIATLFGRGAAVLSGERIALNLVARMSGIATATRAYVERVAGHRARILDTRKTAPGMRALDKCAVAIGGGTNHRFGLFDAAMIKDNHIAAAGGIAQAVACVRAYDPQVPIEVETTTLDEVRQALTAGVELIMLDNMARPAMTEAVALVAGRAKLEASGNITLANVREVAATGVDFISIGALTHSVSAFDISQRVTAITTAATTE